MSNFFNGGSGNSTATFASGGVTNNTVPKSNGSSQLADSSITDDGTTVSTAEVVNLTHAASTTNAVVQFNSVATAGLMFGSANQVGLKANATTWIACDTSSTQAASLPSGGLLGWSSSTTFGASVIDAMLGRRGPANIRIGNPDNNGAVNSQTISVQNAVTGSNLVPATLTIDAPLGTGTGAGGATRLNRTLMAASGTTAQTSANGFVVGSTKILSNTSATVQAIANIALASNSAGGCFVSVTVTATDGTNFDSETQSANVSYVNKAGAITVGTAQITTSSAANNSGSATIGLTFVANGNSIDVKVTPVFTTIVPTIVTSFITIINNGAGAVTIN